MPAKKPKLVMPAVICDTREKIPWTFPNHVVQKLDQGDYSLVGHEKKIIIERKGKVTEFAGNLLEDRFYNELDRLEDVIHPFMILEFTFEDLIKYPFTPSVPRRVQSRARIRGSFLLMKYSLIQLKYKTKIIMAGDDGQRVAIDILKRYWENHESKITVSK